MGTHGFDDGKNIADLSTVMSRLSALENKINNVYPVGSIYMSVRNVNPSTIFGGTWVAWGQGRVPVGMGNGYNVSEGPGGNSSITLQTSQLPAHTHTITPHKHTIEGISGVVGGRFWGDGRMALRVQADGAIVAQYADKNVTLHGKDEGDTGTGYYNNIRLGYGTLDTRDSSSIATGNTGTGAAINIMQPYITCYMWKRTA